VSLTPLTAAPRRARPKQSVIAVLGLTEILAYGSTYYLPAVLAKPISTDTGWPLAWVVGGLSVGWLVSGVASPIIGRTIDRRGGRPVIATSAVLFAAGLTMLGAAVSLPLFFLAWAVIGLGMSAGLYDAVFASLGRLYGTSARSAITALTLWGGFASTICWPLSAFLVDQVGWRGACFTYAAIHLCVALPLQWTVLPREQRATPKPPLQQPLASDEPPAGSPSFLLFIVLAATFTLASAVPAVLSVHLLTILQSQGLALGAAVGLGALVGPSQVAARGIEMLIGRFHHPIWTMIVATTLVTLGLSLLVAGAPIVAVALIFYGGGIGLESIAKGTLPLALFGADGYATLMGKLAVPGLLVQAIAPFIGALLIDRVGPSLLLASVWVLAVANVASAVLLVVLHRSRGRAPVTPA